MHSLLSAAPANNMTIEANHIEYQDGVSPSVLASGDVYFKLQKTEGHAQALSIDWLAETLELEGPFRIEQDRNALTGLHLNLDGQHRLGDIENFEGHFKNAIIRSNNVLIKGSVLEIDDATFTTCDLPKPHTKLTAKHITIYTLVGMVVIRDAVFWIQDVPVFYLPTYIYGGPSLLSSNQLLPDILNDPVQGLTIRQRLGYLINENNAGHTELEWTQNLGWGVGITHGLRWHNRTEIEAEVKTFTVSGLQGHLEIKSKAIAKEKIKNEPDVFMFGALLSTFSDASEDYLLRWNVLLRSREVVNYQRVSALPEVEVASDQLIPGLNLLAASGYFEELGGTSSQRTRLELGFDNSANLIDTWQLHAAVDAKHSAYDHNQSWNRLIVGGDLVHEFVPWTASVGYAVPMLNAGSSPFAFDSYQVQDSPEYRITLDHDQHYVHVNGAFKTTTQRFRTLTFTVEQPLHEWRLVVSVETVTPSLSFGFRLANL